MSKKLTIESAALIADTELEQELEALSVYIPLTIIRGKTPDGTIIPRCFVASTTLHGRTLTAIAGNRRKAMAELQAQVQRLGYEPMWSSFTDLTGFATPNDEPEIIPAPVEEPDADELESAELATQDDEPGEHEEPIHGLVSVQPELDKSGWLTPLSDALAYKRVYLAAWELATGFSVFDFHDLTRDSRNIRASVAALMMSGDAGAKAGVFAKAVNPWALGTDGKTEMPWIRTMSKTPDPTTKPYKAGMGEAREAMYLNLSGLPVNQYRNETARSMRERRAARAYIGTRGCGTVSAENERNMKRDQAHAAGMAAKEAAINAGYDRDTQSAHYKWAYCATLRFLGEVHEVYEQQLALLDITREDILKTVEDMKRQ